MSMFYEQRNIKTDALLDEVGLGNPTAKRAAVRRDTPRWWQGTIIVPRHAAARRFCLRPSLSKCLGAFMRCLSDGLCGVG